MGFWKSDVGATTIDFVVISASIIGLGLAGSSLVSSGVQNVGTDVATSLPSALSVVSTSFGTGTGSYAFVARTGDYDYDLALLRTYDDSTLQDVWDVYWANTNIEQILRDNAQNPEWHYDTMAEFVDSYAAGHQAMAERGLPITTDVPTVQEMDELYTELYGNFNDY